MVFGQLAMPVQCCTGAPAAPTQARFEISGNLEIQKFGIPWNPCDKDFRILDLLEPIIGFNKSCVQWAGIEVKNKKLMPMYPVVLAF